MCPGPLSAFEAMENVISTKRAMLEILGFKRRQTNDFVLQVHQQCLQRLHVCRYVKQRFFGCCLLD